VRAVAWRRIGKKDGMSFYEQRNRQPVPAALFSGRYFPPFTF
jgi:hypothetical protein